MYGVLKPRGKTKQDFDEKSLGRLKELEEGVVNSELSIELINKIVSSLQKVRQNNEFLISDKAFNDGFARTPSIVDNERLVDDTDMFRKAILLDKVNEKRPGSE